MRKWSYLPGKTFSSLGVTQKKYSNKHADNVVDFGPSKLKQQALHHILRHRRKIIEEQQPNATTSCCCSRKRKRTMWEEDNGVDLLMCSEMFDESS